MEEKKKSKIGLNNNKFKENVSKKIPKWKMQSEQLRNQIKINKVDEGNPGGSDQPKFDSKQYDGYTHCDLCKRRYNEEAYKKHLNFCQKKNQKDALLKNNNNNSNTKESSNKNGMSYLGSQKPGLNVKFRK